MPISILSKQSKGISVMLKKQSKPSNNIAKGVELILRGAKKRRSMAIASARMINSEVGVSSRLIALQ